VANRVGLSDPTTAAQHAVDPGKATKTIHWGRNYIYATSLEGDGGALEVVVKQFRNQGLRHRLDRRWRGSKAERSWRAARAIVAAGLKTPQPLMVIESKEADGPSFLVTERLDLAFEVRWFFRRLNEQDRDVEFPDRDPLRFLASLGCLARRLHDAGIVHRDLSMGNILLQAGADGDDELFVIDLNRARCGQRPGIWRRTRDICRLPILNREHRQAFLAGYWGKTPPRLSPRWWLFTASVRGYLLKHAIKNRWRSRRKTRGGGHHGSHHAHIPPAAKGASVRDKAVWDHLSDQPHQHASRLEKLAIRIADMPSHARNLLILARTGPRVLRRYGELKRGLHTNSVPFTGFGLAVRPWEADPRAHLDAIDELGARTFLLRLHPWDEDHRAEEDLARALHERGHEVAFAIPQNRELVLKPEQWRAAVMEIRDRFLPYGCHFQIGQAINRSKWGLWTLDEYVRLYRDAARVLREDPRIVVMGPAVIDFEYQGIVALTNRGDPELFFDVVTSLLYVDRRGAPERTQMGFDTVAKVTLLKAIADTARNAASKCWITEFNWPLWEGPHAPAGRSVSVDDETQANYLVRYALLALCTGLVDRLFWWRVAARGYGLMVPTYDGLVPRRSFFAFKTLLGELDGASFEMSIPSRPGCRLYRFTKEHDVVVVGWCVDGEIEVELPRPAVEVVERDGRVSAMNGATVVLGPDPRYFHLA